MTSYIQIAGDPTEWWPDQPFDTSQLTGQPVSVQITSPVAGFLVISPTAVGVAVFESDQAAPACLSLPAPGIYVPTATGLSAGNAGYQLPASADVANLVSELMTLMQNGGSQTITLGGTAGGSLVLNGATLPFAVLLQASVPMPGTGSTSPPEAGKEGPAEPTGVVPHH